MSMRGKDKIADQTEMMVIDMRRSLPALTSAFQPACIKAAHSTLTKTILSIGLMLP